MSKSEIPVGEAFMIENPDNHDEKFRVFERILDNARKVMQDEIEGLIGVHVLILTADDEGMLDSTTSYIIPPAANRHLGLALTSAALDLVPIDKDPRPSTSSSSSSPVISLAKKPKHEM